MLLFDEKQCINVCLKNTNEYVRLAVNDMLEDFGRISKNDVYPKLLDEVSENCIVIEENFLVDYEPVEHEGFEIKTEGNVIRIIAEGYLGTMWGIYTFCEKCLGVSPCYLFEDFEKQKLERLEIEDINIKDEPKGYKFRGVFINDEDLLTGWIESKTYRNMDYPYYHEVVSPIAMEQIVQTVLRLKLNLIIPASFLNADNPPEKTLADVCAKRGIYVSQHHLEPVGVSGFTFKNWCDKFGKEGEFSYIKNPSLMEEIWQYYADIWAKYPNVVWQIGLRGLADRPIWEEDAKPDDEKLLEYGRFISNAYEKQKEIVLRATGGKAKYFTSTLWMEGSYLASKKAIDFPEGVTVVFADNGPNQMFAPDFDSVPRMENTKYGIYYHVQYWDYGPHMAPNTGIKKLCYNLNRAYNKGDSDYCILNSSSFREFVFELGAYSGIMWNTSGFDEKEYLSSYGELFKEHKDEVLSLVDRYFEACAVLPNESLPKHHGKYFTYNIDEKAEGIKNCIIKDGFILRHGNMIVSGMDKELDRDVHDEIFAEVCKALTKYQQLFKDFGCLTEKLDESASLHVKVKWQNYCSIMMNLYGWYKALYEAKNAYDANNKALYTENVNIAVTHLEDLLEFRKNAEYGKFQNWYRGDIKMKLCDCLECAKKLLNK